MADLFGSPMGELAYDANQRAALTTGANTIEALGRIAMQPAQQKKAQLEAEQLETKVAQEKLFQKLLMEGQGGGMVATAQEGEPGKPVSLVDNLRNIAKRAAGAGLIDKAITLEKGAAEISLKEQQARTAKVNEQLNYLKTVEKNAELTGQVFGGVKSEDDWQRANALYAMQTGQPSPFAALPFSPELVKRLEEQALSQKEKATLEGQRLAREATESYRAAMLSSTMTARQIQADRLRLEQQREERLARSGGGAAAGTPTTEEKDEVKRQLRLSGVETKGLNTDSVNSTAFKIASRARELQRGNKALGREAAIFQAITEAKNNGELEVEQVGGTEVPIFGAVGGEKRFAGRKESKPITVALPPLVNGKPDAAKLKVGTVYNTKRGPAKYKGNGVFESVGE